MTRLQLYRKVKSLAWRRRLTGNLEELETEVSEYLLAISSNQIIVAGYLVKLVGEKLVLEKLPVINSRQLKLDFAKNRGEKLCK